jgi:hypothetical protein
MINETNMDKAKELILTMTDEERVEALAWLRSELEARERRDMMREMTAWLQGLLEK